MNQTETLAYDKLPYFLKKIILFASSHITPKIIPSENYIKFLNCKNIKASLLLLVSYAAKDKRLL